MVPAKPIVLVLFESMFWKKKKSGRNLVQVGCNTLFMQQAVVILNSLLVINFIFDAMKYMSIQ